jgi:vancomycin resistance protein YoaR
VTHLFSGETVPLDGEVDTDALGLVLEGWDEEFVGNPPFPGGVVIESGVPTAAYPYSGQQVDRNEAGPAIVRAVLDPGTQPAVLPIGTKRPRLNNADVDAATDRARLWLSGPVTLRASGSDVSVVFTVDQMAAAFTSEASDEGITLEFDPTVVESFLFDVRSEIESAPVDARFEIGDTEVLIVPSQNGTLIDPETTARNLAIAAESASRRGLLPFVEGAEPEVTTEDLEALGVEHLVSSFTTYHPCCQPRVTNIHLFADAIDGVFLAPGAQLDLNETVGERTTEKGYLEDGTIIRGELVETVGGGVSQFATTFYNAVYWGGFEDITHKPHSFYFSRYPEGVEATISWPLPDLIFRNDSDHGLLVKTEYTDTSITVKFYGNNDGRVVIGAHRDGNTEIDVVTDGGPNARKVSSSVSSRYDFTEPTVEYRANPEFEVDQERQVQRPREGWSVTVTRTIEQGETSTEQRWVVRYLAQREIIEVHPCKVPDAEEECPEPTTTTTTTTEPESTTTTTEGG